MNYFQMCKRFDSVSDLFIRNRDERKNLANYILKLKARGLVVRCFRSKGQRIILAEREPRLDDYFARAV